MNNPETTDLVLQELESIAADFQAEGDSVEQDRYCEWYMQKLFEIDAVEERIKEQYQIMLRELQTRRKALQFKCGQNFRQRVEAMLLANGRKKDGSLKKKSVNLLTGKAGYRSSRPTVEFIDEEAAKKWAVKNLTVGQLFDATSSVDKVPLVIECIKEYGLEKAIKSLNKTPFLEHFMETGELPDGVEFVETQDKFYPQVKDMELPPTPLTLQITGSPVKKEGE